MNNLKKITPFYKDYRGELSHLLSKEEKISSAVLITSKKGSVRANHYHKKDTHHVYIISGKMEYFYRTLEKGSRKKKIIVKEGDVISTPPNILHAMRFLEDTKFIALTTEARDQEKYEKDTVRLKLI